MDKFRLEIESDQTGKLAVACGLFGLLMTLARADANPAIEVDDARKISLMIAAGMQEWIDSDMDLENYLFASGVNVEGLNAFLGVSSLTDFLDLEKRGF
jgi:hypothetical protein